MEKFNPQKFAEEYAERLRAAEEYRPPSLFLPDAESANIGAEFKKVKENTIRGNPGGTGYGTPRGFMRRYQEEYFPQAQRLARDANLPTISEEVDEFVAKTGLPDPRKQAGFFDLQSAKHEIISHMRPYKAGFMPDYRNLPAAMKGMPGFTSNPVSPLNEKFATNLDFMIQDNFSPGSPKKRDFSRARIKGLFQHSGSENSLEGALRKQALDVGKPFTELEPAVNEYMLRNFPEKGGPDISNSVADEIADQLNKKYVPKAKYDFKQKGDLFYPTGGRMEDYFNNRESFQRYLMNSSAKDVAGAARRFSNPGTNYMSTLVPFVGPDTVNVPALKKAAKLSLVDLIPSREAIRDFGKGDIREGATRMVQEYAQGIPVALGAGAMLQSLPAQAAALANPIAAGVAGGFALTKTGEALDEATKQQTGEGLLTKIQQTVNKFAGPGFGTPTTGSAYRGSENLNTKRARLQEEVTRGADTDFKTPMIRQMTPGEVTAANASRERFKNENELQRRFRLAGERFNPSRGEFGITELFAGR